MKEGRPLCGPAFLCLERSPFDAHLRSRPTAARGRATGLYALITVGKTLCSALLVAAAAALVPALPRLGAKMGADVLLFFVNYLLQKAFVY